jgi:hypothetical protein
MGRSAGEAEDWVVRVRVEVLLFRDNKCLALWLHFQGRIEPLYSSQRGDERARVTLSCSGFAVDYSGGEIYSTRANKKPVP